METARGPENEERQQRQLELLAIRCQLGEPKGLTELVDRFHAPLWGYLRATVGDPAVAEELLQEAWVRVFRGLPRLRRPERLRSWLFTVARRAFLDRLRSRYRDRPFEPLDEAVQSTSAAETEDLLAWEDMALLRVEVERLPLPEREAVHLYYHQELDLKHVAEVLSVPVGTVKSRLYRARRRLRTELQKRGVSR